MNRTQAGELLRQIAFTRTLRDRNAAKYGKALAEQDMKIARLEAEHAALANEGSN